MISWFSCWLNSSGRKGSSRSEYSLVLRPSSLSSLRRYFNSRESTLRESSPPRVLMPGLVASDPLSIPFTDDLSPLSFELVRVFPTFEFELIPIFPEDESRLNAAEYIVFKFLKLSELPDILDTLLSLYKLDSRGVLGLFLFYNNLLYDSSSLS